MTCKEKRIRMLNRNIDDFADLRDKGIISQQVYQEICGIVHDNESAFNRKEKKLLTEREKANKYINEILGE